MKKYTVFGFLCLVMFFSAAAVFAQQGGFNGPSATGANTTPGVRGNGGTRYQAPASTVSQIPSLPHKSYVTLTGNITHSLGRSWYMFRDSTGETQIDIERKYWGGLTVGPSDRVEIIVEVDRKRDGRIEVDAKSIRKL